MDKLEAKKNAAIMIAWSDGRKLEYSPKDVLIWIPDNGTDFSFDFDNFDYRIKPEPKTVPLTMEDLYEHFKKGTIFKTKSNQWLERINSMNLKAKEFCVTEEVLSIEEFCTNYTFEDSSPLTKIVEE